MDGSVVRDAHDNAHGTIAQPGAALRGEHDVMMGPAHGVQTVVCSGGGVLPRNGIPLYTLDVRIAGCQLGGPKFIKVNFARGQREPGCGRVKH